MIERTQKPKAEVPPRGWGGISVCLLAGVLLIVSFMDRPPQYEHLDSSEFQLTRAPYTVYTEAERIDMFWRFVTFDWRSRPNRRYGRPAFDLDGKRVFIATGSEHDHAPRELRALAVGDRIHVWTWAKGDKKIAWHAAFNHRTVLDYDTVVKDDARNRLVLRCIVLGIFLFGVGLMLFRK